MVASILNTEELAEIITQEILNKKALDIAVLDVRGISSYADYLIVASATSDRHLQALAEAPLQRLKHDHHKAPQGIEGVTGGQWALVDYGDVILHVFHEYYRDVYQLEALWSQAKITRIEDDSTAPVSVG
ncbi:MAG: ribosome silencing factor [Myxococcota bacterium]|nr:ribosome silencing factor [Myxococcota bacterium]